MATPGGPLITVADMLRDLSEDSSEQLVRTPSSFSHSTFGELAATEDSNSGLAEDDLPKAFEETYKQLDAALKQSGHTWTGLTQELCATLSTADKLVATAHSNLGQLTQEVKRLEELVERGQVAMLKLHSTLGLDTNVPVTGR
ncbi:unnamed protein product [Calypogeia fissa]